MLKRAQIVSWDFFEAERPRKPQTGENFGKGVLRVGGNLQKKEWMTRRQKGGNRPPEGIPRELSNITTFCTSSQEA